MKPEKKPKSEQLMFRASEQLAQAIRRAAAVERRTVADWVRLTIEAALASLGRGLTNGPKTDTSWREQVDVLAAEGWLINGTQRNSGRLLQPPSGPGRAGVLDALLDERRGGR